MNAVGQLELLMASQPDARLYLEDGKPPSLATRREGGGWFVFRGMEDRWQVEVYRPGPLDLSGWDGYMCFDTLEECVDWADQLPPASTAPRADRVRLAKCGSVVLNTHEIPEGLELLDGVECAQCGAYERNPSAWHAMGDRDWDLLCRACSVELEREIYGEDFI